MKNRILSSPRPRSLLVLLILLAVVVLLVTVFLMAGSLLDLPVEQLTADPAVTFNAHPVTGGISYLGILFWAAAGTICLFSYLLLSYTGDRESDFFLASGIITLLLLIDDLYMFHEALIPWYLPVPQWAVYVGYALVVLAYGFRFRKNLLRTRYRYLVVAIFLLGCSVAGDLVRADEGGVAYLAEDLFKLFGIVCWFFYFSLTCTGRIRKQLVARSDRRATGRAA